MITTMTLIKTSTKICIKKAIALSTICIASVASSTIFIPSAFAQYGLGLPRANVGGATRSAGASVESLLPITLLVPGDGAKTLASRPTFYWYMAPPTAAPTDSTTVPQIDSKGDFKVRFYLRDGNKVYSKSVFEAEGKSQESGLYKFTLPENAPELTKGQVQRWQIRWQTNDGGTASNTIALIRRDDDPEVLKAIADAKNDLEKARIYAKSAYWYDAIDAYTCWLSKNPKDDVARAERLNLLKVGLPKNIGFFHKDENKPEEFVPARFANFLEKLDKSKSTISIHLKPKKK